MINVYTPDLSGKEREYLLDAFDSTWISSLGAYVERFQAQLRDFTGVGNAAVVANGTVALHLALHALRLSVGDEVIVPSFTYIASVNTIAQTGATPVFAECRSGDWQLDPQRIEELITPRTRAILAVHLYGGACDMDAICAIARARGLAVIEDCAEALGTTYRGRHVGGFGDVGTFSFFGNKTVTTGEGGAVVTNNGALFERLVMLKGQAQDPNRRYWHLELGFNYRMTNLCAAIGVAQMERLPGILARKRAIARLYRQTLSDSLFAFPSASSDVVSSEWLVSLLLPKGTDRDLVMDLMRKEGVETRPVFYCAHHMPPYLSPDLSLPVSEEISARGISLPSYPALTDEQVLLVCKTLRAALAQTTDQGL